MEQGYKMDIKAYWIRVGFLDPLSNTFEEG